MTKVGSKRFIQGVSAIGAIATIASTSFALSSPLRADSQSKPSPLELRIDESPLQRDQSLKSSYAPIVQRVAPSIVKVFVISFALEKQSSLPDLNFLRRFFGQDQLNPAHPPYQLEHALGSGVIVSPDGYILTNSHVVKNAKEIQVALNDGRSFAAKIVGTDPQTDVALLKVRADNLPELTLTDSDKTNIGDVVLAIGNPFGVGQTVTAGIVSGKHRVTAGDMNEDFIQTDAAINPGNSGGALVDTEGRLIGINAEILSRNGGNQGIGFAVPSNLCRWVMESLVQKGHVDRGFLGIEIQNLTPGLAQAFKAGTTNGALVSGVTPGTPGDAAGLKSGDVIVEFNGQPVTDANQLKLRVAETNPGTMVPLKVKRNGETETFNVTLKELTTNDIAKANISKSNSNNQDVLHGVTVADLDQQTRAQLDIPTNVRGALITEVDPNSAAYQAGLRAGNVILQIGDKPVTDAQDAVSDTAKRISNITLVRVWTRQGIHYLTVNESNVG
jgi:serine protease Do